MQYREQCSEVLCSDVLWCFEHFVKFCIVKFIDVLLSGVMFRDFVCSTACKVLYSEVQCSDVLCRAVQCPSREAKADGELIFQVSGVRTG